MSGPLVLRLLPGRPLTHEAIGRRLHALHGSRVGHGLAPRFALGSRERRFVRALLGAKSNLWLWRCRQDAFAGDFVAVDMSAESPAERSVFMLELKQGAPIKSVAGHQMRKAAAVLEEISRRTGAIPPTPVSLPLTGDGGGLVAHLSGGRRAGL